MELIYYPTTHHKRCAAENGNTADAAIQVVRNECGRSLSHKAKSRDGGTRHFPLPLPLLPPLPWLSLVCWLIVASIPLPLILSTLPLPLNVQPRPIKAPPPLFRWRLSSHLPLIFRLVVAWRIPSAILHGITC
jgi:hypothetical protein